MRTHSQAPINQDPCACLLGHWFPHQAVYLSCPGLCVCVRGGFYYRGDPIQPRLPRVVRRTHV
jgi:hypothetical protein